MLSESLTTNREKSQITILQSSKAVAIYPLLVTILKRWSTKSLVSKSSSASTTWGNLLPKFETPVNQTPSRQLFTVCKNRPRARAFRSRCRFHRKRESQRCEAAPCIIHAVDNVSGVDSRGFGVETLLAAIASTHGCGEAVIEVGPC